MQARNTKTPAPGDPTPSICRSDSPRITPAIITVPPPGTTGGITQKASIDLDIIPITLNYKYEAALTDRLNYFLGLGLGIAILDSSYDWRSTQALPPPYGQRGGSEDQTDVRFYGEVFAGLTYDVCAYFELYAGVRYIFMDDVDRNIDVIHVSDYKLASTMTC